MATNSSTLSEQQVLAIRELSDLRSFSGSPRDFWPRFLSGVAAVASASGAVLMVRPVGGLDLTDSRRGGSASFQDASKPDASGWKRLGEWSANLGPSRILTAFHHRLEAFATDCAKQGESLLALLEQGSSRHADHFVIASVLKLPRSTEMSVVILLLSEFSEAAAREALVRLKLAMDVPESYRLQQANSQAAATVQKLATALDLMVAVNSEKRFVATALAFCNGLAATFKCERVSLGWFESGYIRLRAISRTEKFNRKMGIVRSLETAMDEALDQDEEVLWPPPEGASLSTRDHSAYAAEQKPGHICSLPMRVENRAIAVVTCERLGAPFTAAEVDQLRLCCDQATRRLLDLYKYDRWFGARIVASAKENAAVLVGPKHTWAKITALLCFVALCVLFFVRVPYRVEGSFVVKSEDVSFRTAPFDAYIEQVFVRPGDTVQAGSPLVKLVTRELELEEMAANADLARFLREAEKARAGNDLAAMRIATALAEQARARLDLVRHRLDAATLKAPFNGVIVEGDLRDRLAAPVKQGDTLLKIARLENLYVETEIKERDVHEILTKSAAEISFLSQPRLTFPVKVAKLEPAAFPRTDGNVFLVRCDFVNGVQNWWRPGMSGLCKVDVERRTLWWILTHRTVDFLRMKLWW